MSHSRLVTVAVASAMLFTAPALAGNGGATPAAVKTLRVEQLGPKYLLGKESLRTEANTHATRIIPLTFKTLVVEELGPKFLLGR
jgi:hypothetical protein